MFASERVRFYLAIASLLCLSYSFSLVSGADLIKPQVRIHLLKSNTREDLNTTLQASEVATLFQYFNKFWSQADIEWQLESTLEEYPTETQQQDFQDLVDEDNEQTYNSKISDVLADTRPTGTIAASTMFEIYFVHTFGSPSSLGTVLGIYLIEEGSIFMTGKNLHEPLEETPITFKFAHTVAHELGHAVCLAHPILLYRRSHLMSWHKGEELADVEIDNGREKASKGKPWTDSDGGLCDPIDLVPAILILLLCFFTFCFCVCCLPGPIFCPCTCFWTAFIFFMVLLFYW